MTLDDVGDPDGVPLLYLHGTPDSRPARPAEDAVAARIGVRLLALDRHCYSSDPLAVGSPWTAPLAREVTGCGTGSPAPRPTSRHRPGRSTSICPRLHHAGPARPASGTDPADAVTPPAFGEWYARSSRPRRSTSSPAATVDLVPGAAHYPPFTRWADILTTLAAAHGC